MTAAMKSFVVALVLLLPVAAAAQQPPQTPRDQPVVVTSGDGVVQAVPDRAFITISAESRASNPRDAQRKNVDAMKPVLDRLRAAGIPEDAIRTTQYDLQPDWEYRDNSRVFRGYVARNSIDVRVDATDRVGELLEMAVVSGATSIGGVRFEMKDRDRLEREALRLAVADARARAVAAAGGAGLFFDRILRIEEQGVSSPPIPGRPVLFSAEAKAADAPPIAAGEIEVRAHVTVTSLLKN